VTTTSDDASRDDEVSDDDDALLALRRRARAAAKSRAEPKAKAARGGGAPDSGPGTLDEEDLDPEFLRSAQARRGFSLVFGGGAVVAPHVAAGAARCGVPNRAHRPLAESAADVVATV